MSSRRYLSRQGVEIRFCLARANRSRSKHEDVNKISYCRYHTVSMKYEFKYEYDAGASTSMSTYLYGYEYKYNDEYRYKYSFSGSADRLVPLPTCTM